MILKLSSLRLSESGLLVFVLGITASTFLFGAQSIQYMAFVFLAVTLTLPNYIKASNANPYFFYHSIPILISPLLLYLIHALAFQADENYPQSAAPYFAISIAVYLAINTAVLPEKNLINTMKMVAAFHFMLCVYAIYKWESKTYGDIRFGALGVREAIWAEIALGAYVAALLSKDKRLIIVVAVASIAVIFGAQMRGSGIAVLLSLITYLTYSLWRKHLVSFLFIITATPLLLVIFWNKISTIVRKLLLLDDPHRGIDSGFSGRFENWTDGINRFIESPLFGVGFYDSIASYTHNGILKSFAQLGVFYGSLIWIVYLYSIYVAFKLRRQDLLAALFCYVIFISSAPRYINFQLMPFIALVAIAHTVFIGTKNKN